MVGASYLSFEKSVPRPRTAALEGYNSWLKGAGTTPRTALFSSTPLDRALAASVVWQLGLLIGLRFDRAIELHPEAIAAPKR